MPFQHGAYPAWFILTLTLASGSAWGQETGARLPSRPYVVVDTGQDRCYGDRATIDPPAIGEPYHGQDAQHAGHAPSYRDLGDGTVLDLNTGLMWVKARGEKVTWAQARAGASACRAGGHADWRMPSVKELYSLIDFRGSYQRTAARSRPFLDTRYFEFAYGNESRGERGIDCQDWSSTVYTRVTMNNQATVFGVNFADGRIKGYPTMRGPAGRQTAHRLFVRYVRGTPEYGRNVLQDHGDGVITDHATGLSWTKVDSGRGMNWREALAYAEGLTLAGHDDWRLPNAKELQSIVDYSCVPAIDPRFELTRLPDGEYPFYWTSTTHLDGPPDRRAQQAVYLALGRATGWMSLPGARQSPRLMDVHGAGAQRSDPKSGDPADFPRGRGPQGDVIRIDNFVLCVRGG